MEQSPGRDRLPVHDPAATGPDAELSRLRAGAMFHQRFRELTLAFSRDFTSTVSLPAALAALTADARHLLGARRTAVWLYDRRLRELRLATTSDAGSTELAVRVSSDDRQALPAQGLRLERPRAVASPSDFLLLVPLRGWRRALGTLIVEGPFTEELDGAQLVDLAEEIGRQLASAIETIQLIEEVLRQRRLLEDTFDSLVELVVVTDAALRIVQVNEAFTARSGLSRGELLARPLEGLIGDDMLAWIADARAGGDGSADRARTRQFEDRRLNGTFTVTVTPLASHGGEPAGQVIVVRDITRQTRLEREREVLRERLAQSEKLASLGQFVAGIAHEMNNPLQGVLGHLELLMATSADAQPLRRELRGIFHEAGRAAKIVRNLMMFTGSRRLTRRPLAVHRLIGRVVASRAAARRAASITLSREDAANLPRIAGDQLLLHQVFLNVVINAEHAIETTGRPGRIDIRCRLDPQSNRVVTTVHDSGPGIPQDILPRIFDPFFTTKEVGKGTGLGLALAYGIVQDHGGAIYAANDPDGGATVTIEIPAWPAGATPGP